PAKRRRAVGAVAGEPPRDRPARAERGAREREAARSDSALVRGTRQPERAADSRRVGRTFSPVPLLALCLVGLAASLVVSPHSPFAAAAARPPAAAHTIGAPDRAVRVGGFPLPAPEPAAPPAGHL